MDPTAADYDAPDVAPADQSATETRRGDTLYRRPPAHPPVESTTGGSWFAGGADGAEPYGAEPAEPDYGPAPPSGSGRTSFGFTAGPISPVRSAGGSTDAPSGRQAGAQTGSQTSSEAGSQTGAQAGSQTGSRKRRTGPRPSSQTGSQAGSHTASQAASRTGSQAASRTGSQAASRTGSQTGSRSGSQTGELPLRRQSSRSAPAAPPPAPAARQAAPSSAWPQPIGLPPEESTYDRMPVGGALRGSSGEYAAWPDSDSTEERRLAQLRVPSGEYAAWPDSDTTEERRLTYRDVSPEVPRSAHRDVPSEVPRTARQSRVVTAGIALLSLIVLIGGAAVGVVYFSGADDDVDSVLELGAGGTAKRTVSAPLDNRTKASFELLASASAVHVTIGELGDDLYRISTPEDAGFRPSPVIRNDEVKLQVTQDGDGTGGEIEVVLSAKVRWALRFSGYAETQVVDVSGGQVSQIEMVAGMRRAEVTLSRPTGTVPLKINGAVETLILKSPLTSPVRIKVGGGAQTVVAGSRTLKDVAAGSTLTPKGWDTSNRYDVTAGARITALTIENA